MKLQIAELQATAAAQTAEINRLLDRIDHLERMLNQRIQPLEERIASLEYVVSMLLTERSKQ